MNITIQLIITIIILIINIGLLIYYHYLDKKCNELIDELSNAYMKDNFLDNVLDEGNNTDRYVELERAKGTVSLSKKEDIKNVNREIHRGNKKNR